jgi:hypothetical protein
MANPQHQPHSYDIHPSSYSTDDLCHTQNDYYSAVTHDQLLIDQSFAFPDFDEYNQQLSCTRPEAHSHIQPNLSVPASFDHAVNELYYQHLGPSFPPDYGCPSQRDTIFSYSPDELTYQHWPDELSDGWDAPRFIANATEPESIFEQAAYVYEVSLHPPERSSSSLYAGSPSTLDTSTLVGSTPKSKFQGITPSSGISPSLAIETFTATDSDCGFLEEDTLQLSKPIVSPVEAPKHGGRQSARKDANASRRQSKLNRRLQELQGGNFDVFDSVEGRNCSHPRASFTPSRRKEVAAVRARGACFKCKLWKKKVCQHLIAFSWCSDFAVRLE